MGEFEVGAIGSIAGRMDPPQRVDQLENSGASLKPDSSNRSWAKLNQARCRVSAASRSTKSPGV
jgi:hypothetical protein